MFINYIKNMSAMAQPAFPRHFSYFVNKLAGGFKKNKIRLVPLGGTTISPSQTFQIRLPTNSLIIPDSFSLFGSLVIPANATAPQHGLSSLIQKVDVRINGSSIAQGGTNSFNVLYNMMMACQGSKELIRKNSGLNRAQPVIYGDITNASKTIPVCCSEWVGTWLSSCRPGIQSTSLLGEVVVEFQMDSNRMLVGNETYDGSDWSLTNTYATIEVVNFSNDLYLPMLYARIQSGEMLPCLYTYVANFQQTATSSGDLRVSVSSSSLDMILVSHRLSGDITAVSAVGASAPLSVVENNVKRGKQFCSRAIASQTNAGTDFISQYVFLIDGVQTPAVPVNTRNESYNHLLRVLGQEDNLLSHNLLLETYEVRQAGVVTVLADAYVAVAPGGAVTSSVGPLLTSSANQYYLDIPGCKTKSVNAAEESNWATPLTYFSTPADYRYNPYYNGNFFTGVSLRDEQISPSENYKSGYDTQGSVAEIIYRLTIDGNYSPFCDIFAFQTAQLNIGAQQVIRVEY
jgi:hypothetical protein